jgi:hypothetical protein
MGRLRNHRHELFAPSERQRRIGQTETCNATVNIIGARNDELRGERIPSCFGQQLFCCWRQLGACYQPDAFQGEERHRIAQAGRNTVHQHRDGALFILVKVSP